MRDEGDLPGAIAAYREALRLDPQYALGHNNLANALQDAGDLPGAIAAFREAIRLGPGDAVVYSNLGAALSRAAPRFWYIPGTWLRRQFAVRKACGLSSMSTS